MFVWQKTFEATCFLFYFSSISFINLMHITYINKMTLTLFFIVDFFVETFFWTNVCAVNIFKIIWSAMSVCFICMFDLQRCMNLWCYRMPWSTVGARRCSTKTTKVFNFLNKYFDHPVFATDYWKHKGVGMDWPPYSPSLT